MQQKLGLEDSLPRNKNLNASESLELGAPEQHKHQRCKQLLEARRARSDPQLPNNLKQSPITEKPLMVRCQQRAPPPSHESWPAIKQQSCHENSNHRIGNTIR